MACNNNNDNNILIIIILLSIFFILILFLFIKKTEINKETFYGEYDGYPDRYQNPPPPPISTWTPYYVDINFQPGYSNYFYRNGYMYPIY